MLLCGLVERKKIDVKCALAPSHSFHTKGTFHSYLSSQKHCIFSQQKFPQHNIPKYLCQFPPSVIRSMMIGLIVRMFLRRSSISVNLKFFLLFVSCIYVVHIKIIYRMVFLHIIWVVIKWILIMTEASKGQSQLRTF